MPSFVPPRDRPDYTAPVDASWFKLMQEEERAEGLRPPRGRPRKYAGPREPNGRASRRKADNLSRPESWRNDADDLWRTVALSPFKHGLSSKPSDPLFLNLARRSVLDVHAMKIALLWWSSFYVIHGKELLREALSIKAYINFQHERAYKTHVWKNEGREVARAKLGEDFVYRMDGAIFRDDIPDVAAFVKDLIAVRDVWRSQPCGPRWTRPLGT